MNARRNKKKYVLSSEGVDKIVGIRFREKRKQEREFSFSSKSGNLALSFQQ